MAELDSTADGAPEPGHEPGRRWLVPLLSGVGLLVGMALIIARGDGQQRPDPVSPPLVAYPRDGTAMDLAQAYDPIAGLATPATPQPERDPFVPPGGLAPAAEPAEDAANAETAPVAPVQPIFPAQPIVPRPEPTEPPAAELPTHVPDPTPSPPAATKRERPEPPAETAAPAEARPAEPSQAELRALDPAQPPDFEGPPSPAEPIELTAVVQSRRPLAVFRQEGRYVRAHVGDSVAGCVVERIAGDRVYLRDGPRRYELRLMRGSRRATAAPDPAPATASAESSASAAPAPAATPQAVPRAKPAPPFGPPLPAEDPAKEG